MRVNGKIELSKEVYSHLNDSDIKHRLHMSLLDELEKQVIFIDNHIEEKTTHKIILTSSLFVLTANDIDRLTNSLEEYPELKDKFYKIIVEGK